MSQGLAGRVIVITGASAGIGAAVARRAASTGARVVVSARRLDRLQMLAAQIRSQGGIAEAVQADVTRAEEMQTLVRRTIGTFGRIDVMVANAGIGYHRPFDATPETIVDRLVAVNLMGTFNATRAALAGMRAQGHGHLIAVSSIVGRRGVGGAAVYSATKAAQIAFVESLRSELAGTAIHASVVLPVSTVTEFRETMARDYGLHVRGTGPRQSADVVARAVVRCIIKPRGEVYPYPLGRVLSVLNAAAPGLTDRLIRRFRRDSDADPESPAS